MFTDNPLTNAVIILCIGLMAWYAMGTWLNRRRAMSIVHDLRTGLGDLGDRLTYQFRPSTGLDIKVGQPKPPYARVRVHLMLEAREVLFLWLVNHYLRGRRDQFIIEADLTRRPDTEVLVVDPGVPLGKLALSRAHERGQATRPVATRSGTDLQRWASTKPGERLAADFARNGTPPGMPLWVLATQKKSPQLVVICGLDQMNGDSVRHLLRRVRELALRVER